MAVHSGFTANTAKHLVLDAGAFYKNYDLDAGTGALLGATRGGGEFTATPTIRAIEVDGVKGRAKGLNSIDTWEVSITANMLEITAELLADALATGSVDTISNATYDIVTASNTIALANYIDNITWVGRLSGSNNPVIIQIYNALNTEGVTLTAEDKNESVLPVTFTAHYDAGDLDTVPFKLFYPKMTGDTTPPTVTVLPANGATDVAVSANVVWTFSEAVNSSTVTPANFMVMGNAGESVAGSLSLNVAKTVVTFNPTSDLDATSDYLSIVTTNVQDLNGNSLAAQNVSSFTTA